MLCGLRDSRSHEYMYSSSSRYSVCLVSEAPTPHPHFSAFLRDVHERRFEELLQGFPYLASVAIFHLSVVRQASQHLEYLSSLLALSLQLFTQVFFFASQ